MARTQCSVKRGRIEIARTLVVALAAICLAPAPRAQDSASSPPAASPSQESQPSQSGAAAVLPRGKKLMLKDGGFQLVREYQVKGDRVRYYSLERSLWEEIPTELVDWDATKRVAADEAQRDAAMAAKVRAQEEARRAEESLDIDASLEVTPGVFLPPGEGLFAFDGKAVLQLPQARTSAKLAKGRVIERVLVPVPIISTRHTVSIQGARGKLRLKDGQPEFYMRTADARQPEMELIRAKIRGDSRQIENLDQLFGRQVATRDTLLMQRWQVAGGVYRFTLGQTLEPGEYALLEIVQGQGTGLYVWDFGVDQSAAAAPKPK